MIQQERALLPQLDYRDLRTASKPERQDGCPDAAVCIEGKPLIDLI